MALLEPVDCNQVDSKNIRVRGITTLLLILFIVQVSIAQQYNVVAPQSFVAGKAYPFVLEVENQNGLDLFHSEEISLNMTGTTQANGLIKIKKGRAMYTGHSSGSNTLGISSAFFSINPTVNSNSIIEHSGIISTNQTWSANSVHHISSQLTISSGDTLEIENGCWVLLDSAVNVVIEGHLKVLGTAQNPTVFAANSESGWGGLIFASGTGDLEYALFNNGGNDASRAYGHSGSQATVKSDGGNVLLDHCFVFDCVGKGIGSQNGYLEFNNGGISHCDMGGEFAGSQTVVRGSHILDIPNDNGIFQDDDNDGFYFAGANPSNDLSVVDSCVFMYGKDDAIDHNGAILEVKNSWIEYFEHEGIAASNQNSVSVFNSLFKDCEQGIEAGYGSPTVTVNHCVMVNNDYGLRFGDWYDWGCWGTISCTNSIMVNNNADNVHNFDYQSNGPINGAITLTYSIPTDAEYDAGTGCIVGTPTFNSEYQLEPNSPGLGTASDGSNMGLLSTVITGLEEAIEPKPADMIQFNIYSIDGKRVASGNRSTDVMRFRERSIPGVYFVEEIYPTQRLTRKIAIIR